MKIAQVTKYFHPHRGGIESNVLGISEGLADLGAEVLILTSDTPRRAETEELSGIKILRSTCFFTAFNDPFTPGIFKNLMTQDYDIIHIHLPDPFNSVYALLAAKIRKKPLYVTYHADVIKNRWYHTPFKAIYSIVSYRLFKTAVRIIATTPDYVKESQIPPEFRDKVVIVPNFVDSGKYIPELSGHRIRKEHNLENKKSHPLPRKACAIQGSGIPAHSIQKSQGKGNRCRPFDCGKRPAGGETEKQAAEQNLSGVVFTHPNDDDIPEYYAACDLFVLPSITRQEAFGIVLLEAMSSGKPVISTNISGMPYVVGDAGIVVPPKDADALADAITKILTDNDLRIKMGRRARERVEKEFNKESAAKKQWRPTNQQKKLTQDPCFPYSTYSLGSAISPSAQTLQPLQETQDI